MKPEHPGRFPNASDCPAQTSIKPQTKTPIMLDRQLVIMAKQPVAGRVKTRLARDLGAGRATGFYRASLRATLHRVCAPGRWRTILAHSPDTISLKRFFSNVQIEERPQGPGDLGERMQRIFDTPGCGPVVIIGSDIAGISRRAIAAAFDRLGNHDAVLGPSSDGGYWLVGLKRFPHVPRAFTGVRWSTSETLADTVRALSGCRIANLQSLEDVDDIEDFRQGQHAVCRVIAPL